MSPAQLWLGIERPRRILYVTKLAVFRWMAELIEPTDPLVLYACGGLPSAAVCQHLRATQAFFHVPAFFLGDLDPGDLTVLLALTRGNPRLRAGQPGASLCYSGVGDRLLAFFRRWLSAAQFRAAVIEMTSDEQDHLQLVRQIFLNLEQVIGRESMGLLARGKKIEVEGLLRWARPGSKRRAELRSFLLGN